MNLRMLEVAAQESSEAADYYEDEQEELGIRFRASVLHCVNAIESNPRMYAKVDNPPANREIRGRSVESFPYQIIYEILDEEIIILAVVHYSRNPGYWRRRKP